MAVRKNYLSLFILGLLLALTSAPLGASEPQDSINALLARVEKADCKFIRNGSEHTGKEAATHMRRKYDHFRKEIATPEQFIDKCASKSELSGKPYQVALANGKVVRSDVWMKEQLAAIRADQTSGGGGTPQKK